jgi:hypothetical protein
VVALNRQIRAQPRPGVNDTRAGEVHIACASVKAARDEVHVRLLPWKTIIQLTTRDAGGPCAAGAGGPGWRTR